MNKTELINAMAVEAGLPKTMVRQALEAFTTSVSKAMRAGEKVSLTGFGTFFVSERAARTGVNPATKELIEIPAKKIVKFKPGTELTAE